MNKQEETIHPKIAEIIEEFVEESHLFGDVCPAELDDGPDPNGPYIGEHPPHDKPEAGKGGWVAWKKPEFSEHPPHGDIDKRLMDYSKEYTSNKPYSKDLPRPEDHNR